MGKYNVHAGHNPANKVACGAVGLINESTENRNVAKELIKILREQGHTVYDCTVDNGVSASDIINKIVTKANTNTVDLDISIHFNSGAKDVKGNGSTTGVEVLVYKTGGESEVVAKRICNKVSNLGFKNRGVKVRTDLGYLKRTKAPALLVECAFVDDYDDTSLYNYEKMALAIAEGILNKTIELNKVTESTYYRVVAGSFTKRDNAQKVVNDLKNKNYSAFIDIYKTAENTYYRVVAGSYSKIENAQNTVDNLRGEGFSAFIDIYKK